MKKLTYKIQLFVFRMAGLSEQDYIAYRNYKAIELAERGQSATRFDKAWSTHLHLSRLLKAGYKQLAELERKSSN
jgi:Mn-dependent DtxR family transcriptional regulator